MRDYLICRGWGEVYFRADPSHGVMHGFSLWHPPGVSCMLMPFTEAWKRQARRDEYEKGFPNG
jgi:hypothetical protein